MILSNIEQISSLEYILPDIDVMICGCGYEERSTYLVQKEAEAIGRIPNKQVLTYISPDNEILKKNTYIYYNNGFHIYKITGKEDLRQRIQFFSDFFNKIDAETNLNVLFDYSSLSREWYGAFILFLEIYKPQYGFINCWFYYSSPKATSSQDDKFSISDIRPLSGFSSFSFPDKPMTLVVGLGKEEKVLNGLQQFSDVDSSYIHYFYTQKEQNIQPRSKYDFLFNNIEEKQKHEYSLENIIKLFNNLCDLYTSLQEKYRMTIISCGPKPFTLISLIFAHLYKVNVWKMHNNLSDHYITKEPSGEAVILHIEYRNANL